MRAPRGRGRFLHPVAVSALVLASCGGTGGTAGSIQASRSAPPAPISFDIATASWQLPAPVARAVVVAVGPRLFVMGGVDASDSSVSTVYSIDPATGASTSGGTLTQPTHDAAGAVLGTTAFVFGGGQLGVYRDVQAITQGSARTSGTLPQPRADSGAATVGLDAYVVGGYDGTNLVPGVLATPDGSSFRVVAQLAQPVRYPAVAALGSSIYLFGGELSGGESAGTPTAAIQRIDTVSGSVQIVGQLPVALGHASAVALGGHLLVFGGRTQGGVVGSVYRFDPATRVVSLVGQLPQPVADAGAAVIGDTAWVVGGEIRAAVTSVERVRLR